MLVIGWIGGRFSAFNRRVRDLDHSFPAQSSWRYSLRLKRTGAKLEFSAGRAPGALRLLHSEDINDGKLAALRVSTDHFPAPTLIDVRLVKLRIVAGNFSRSPAAPPPPVGSDWNWLLWPAEILTTGLAGYAAWTRFQRRRRTP